MALGATRGGVLRLVLQSLLSTVALGAAAGLGLSVILAKVLATSTQATVRSPAILLPSAGVLLAVAALASLFPAWRAASIEPMKAIRTE
jgi:ABC-type antimicrobial peptide transport system permease subunit